MSISDSSETPSSPLSSPESSWFHAYSRAVAVVLAVAGGVITSYLTATKIAAQNVAGCGEGAGCGVVLSSRWAMFLGVPTALWGLLAFVGVLVLAALPDEVPFMKRWRWPALFSLTTAMLVFEWYMAYLMAFVIKALCVYCATAIAITTVLWLTVVFGHKWVDATKAIVGGLAVAIATLLITIGVYAAQPQPASAMATGLATHFRQTDIKMYGASWCPHCQEQKALFGSAFAKVPYVECSPNGRSAPQAAECAAEGIKTYPTWILDGERYYGIQTLEELAALTGFKWEIVEPEDGVVAAE